MNYYILLICLSILSMVYFGLTIIAFMIVNVIYLLKDDIIKPDQKIFGINCIIFAISVAVYNYLIMSQT